MSQSDDDALHSRTIEALELLLSLLRENYKRSAITAPGPLFAEPQGADPENGAAPRSLPKQRTYTRRKLGYPRKYWQPAEYLKAEFFFNEMGLSTKQVAMRLGRTEKAVGTQVTKHTIQLTADAPARKEFRRPDSLPIKPP